MGFISVATPKSDVQGWINITATKGGFYVKDVPLANYLFSEGIIDRDLYMEIKGKPFNFTMNPTGLQSSKYEFEGKTNRTLELKGIIEVGENTTYGISLKAGFDTVPSSYILAGLLMIGNPFGRKVVVSSSGEKSKAGYMLTKVWLNLPDGETPDGYKFSDFKDLDNQTRFDMLMADHPGKVYDASESAPEQSEDDLASAPL